MKHIKGFNESEIISMRRDLLLLCRNHLVDMVDNWETKFFVRKGEDHYNVEIRTTSILNWLDIKDIFIPFFEILIYYNLKPYSGRKVVKMNYGIHTSYIKGYYTKDSIINDTIDNNIDCSSISFNIKKS